jgi:ferric-chelate reductase
MKEPWFYLGVAATVAMSMLLVLSSIWLRKQVYEIFLLLHIALSVLVIVSLF